MSKSMNYSFKFNNFQLPETYRAQAQAEEDLMQSGCDNTFQNNFESNLLSIKTNNKTHVLFYFNELHNHSWFGG
jgi:hypothetical protein